MLDPVDARLVNVHFRMDQCRTLPLPPDMMSIVAAAAGGSSGEVVVLPINFTCPHNVELVRGLPPWAAAPPSIGCSGRGTTCSGSGTTCSGSSTTCSGSELLADHNHQGDREMMPASLGTAAEGGDGSETDECGLNADTRWWDVESQVMWAAARNLAYRSVS